MNLENNYAARKQVLWGLVLIAVGVIFLLDRMDLVDLVDLREVWHYWPLVLVAVGINQTIGYPSAREFSQGLWTVFIGLWLFAVLEGFLGLTFRNSWPLFLLMWGLQMVLSPVIERRFASTRHIPPAAPSKENEHA